MKSLYKELYNRLRSLDISPVAALRLSVEYTPIMRAGFTMVIDKMNNEPRVYLMALIVKD